MKVVKINYCIIFAILIQGRVHAQGSNEVSIQVDSNDMILSTEEFGAVLKEVLEADSGDYAKQMKEFLIKILKGENLININLKNYMANEAKKLGDTIREAQPQLIGARISTLLRKCAFITIPISDIIKKITGSEQFETLSKVIEVSEAVGYPPSKDSECGSPSVKAAISKGIFNLVKGLGETSGFLEKQLDSAINSVVTPVISGLRSLENTAPLSGDDLDRILNANDENFKALFRDYMGKVIEILKMSYDQFLNDDQRNLVSSAFLNFKNTLLQDSRSKTVMSDLLLTPGQRKLKENKYQSDKCDVALQNALVVLFNPNNTNIKVPKLDATVKTTRTEGFSPKTDQNQEKEYMDVINMHNKKLAGVFDEIFKKLNIIKGSNTQTYTKVYSMAQHQLQDILDKFRELPVLSKEIPTGWMTVSALKKNPAHFQRTQKVR